MNDTGNTVAAGGNGAGEIAPPPASRGTPSRGARLGEELPVFCERCGYSLHGLVQIRCEMCNVLHFSCPECGHHQPINTLRPAFQRVLGRLRALGLSAVMVLKINFFLWPLILFGALGGEVAYRYDFQARNGQYATAPFIEELGVMVFLFAAAFTAVGRMLLLRWRKGVLVGLVLGALVVLALIIGAHLWQMSYRQSLASPMTGAFLTYLFIAFAGGWVGAACVWGIWVALAHAFLPKRIAVALLEWQRAMSDPQAATRTDATNSVTA